MPKAKKPNFKKACSKVARKIDYVKEGISTVRSKEWAEPVGVALGATASICNGMGNFVPGAGIVGGGLKMGASLLNPNASLADVNRVEKGIKASLEENYENLKDEIDTNFRKLSEEKESFQPEIRQDLDEIKKEVQESALRIAVEMDIIKKELSDIKSIVNHTYRLVRDVRYRDGIEKIEAAYETFLKGANNLDVTLAELDHFIFELKVLVAQKLSPERIKNYIQDLKVSENFEVIYMTFQYVIVVRGMYLQLACAYYIWKIKTEKDSDRIASEFNSFNSDFKELCKVFHEEVGTKFDPENLPSKESLTEVVGELMIGNSQTFHCQAHSLTSNTLRQRK